MNINEFTRLFRMKVLGEGKTGDVVRLKLDRVEQRRIRVLSHVAVENKTSDGTKDRLGIESGKRDYYLAEITDPLANELISSSVDILLGEGDVFFCEFTGTTDGDELAMTAIGWEIDI